MSNSQDKSVIVAIFDGEGIAEDAANKLKGWDEASDAVQLGGLTVMTMQDGKVVTKKMGGREGGKGAKWGAIAGVVAGVLSGGVTLLGGLVVGAVGGGLLGSLKKTGAPITEEHIAQINEALKGGKSALVVMCDEHEIDATSDMLKALGGETRAFVVPAEAMATIEAQPEVTAAAAESGDEDKSV
jgi:uncharacterized membrane protein